MGDIDDILAKRVRLIREKQGLSQEQLSVRAGLHERYVGQLERQERGATFRAAHKLAGVLGVTLSELADEAERAETGSPALTRVLAILRERREPEIETIARAFQAIFRPPASTKKIKRPGR